MVMSILLAIAVPSSCAPFIKNLRALHRQYNNVQMWFLARPAISARGIRRPGLGAAPSISHHDHHRNLCSAEEAGRHLDTTKLSSVPKPCSAMSYSMTGYNRPRTSGCTSFAAIPDGTPAPIVASALSRSSVLG